MAVTATRVTLVVTWSEKRLTFKMALQAGPLQVTGSYRTGGKSSLSFKGEYKQATGTTVRVDSIREDGHAFQLSLS